MSTKKLLILALAILVIEVAVLVIFGGLTPQATSDGEVFARVGFFEFVKYNLGLVDFQNVESWNVDGTPEGQATFWSLNRGSTIFMLVIDFFLVAMAFLATRKMNSVPGKLQSAFEIIVDMFSGLVDQALGSEGRRHIPMLGSLFLFLWFANIIGTIPFTEEPTRDLNVTVGHMLAVIFVVHFESIRVKGLGAYLKGYLDPFFIMAPLNIIGEVAKGVSLAFRLFGNILGGAIIVMVISYLARYTMIPVGLNLFFSLFVGTIQAFVFTMLAMTYIAVAIAD